MVKVLIVEDDTTIAQMYQFKLKSTGGYDVKTAKNGQEGLKLAESFKPDLILLDLLMPVMDGSEMLEKLRASDWGNEIKVIVLTNISKDEAPQHLRFLGVDRYIIKAHYTPKQVVEVVKEVLD